MRRARQWRSGWQSQSSGAGSLIRDARPREPRIVSVYFTIMKMTNALLLAVATFIAGMGIAFYIARAHPPNAFLSGQMNDQKAGIRWAEYKLWDAYHHGTHGLGKNPAKAQKWLSQFVRDVYAVRFKPAGDFHPRNAADYLKDIMNHTPQVQSANDRIGVAGFFRTTKEGDKLFASFLTNEPDKLRSYIEANPDLEFISSEPMTPQSFVDYEQSPQESL